MIGIMVSFSDWDHYILSLVARSAGLMIIATFVSRFVLNRQNFSLKTFAGIARVRSYLWAFFFYAMLPTYCSPHTFFKMGKFQPLHQNNTSKDISSQSIAVHGSHKVVTWINRQKLKIELRQQYIKNLFYYLTISRTSWIYPKLLSPNGCTIIHFRPLLPLLEIKTHTDPVGNYRYNLQKRMIFWFIEENSFLVFHKVQITAHTPIPDLN
jgi:hypothetical protein